MATFINQRFSEALFLIALVCGAWTKTHNLHIDYTFSTVLHTSEQEGKSYILHWDFDLKESTIRFAVNVSTTGWVGFGLSPNGQMPGSDVVIGWVDDDGNAHFHVR